MALEKVDHCVYVVREFVCLVVVGVSIRFQGEIILMTERKVCYGQKLAIKENKNVSPGKPDNKKTTMRIEISKNEK